MIHKIVIGTRGSQLALWQTNRVKNQLEGFYPGLEVEVIIITTKGDRVLDVSLPKLGEQGKGLFTKELEEAILDGSIDLAVHSLKDLPTELPGGLHIGAVCEREDVRDALVAGPEVRSFDDLPQGAVIGTSSLRRQAQILARRPDLVIEPIRGNVDTRLRKLDQGEYKAIVLASAGLHRLGLVDRITQYLDAGFVLPAVGQGALAIETRAGDEKMNEILRSLDHEPTRLACLAERAFLKGLGGGCLVPIAALARIENRQLGLAGLVAKPDGSEVIRSANKGRAEDAEEIGKRLAGEMLKQGADRLLSSE